MFDFEATLKLLITIGTGLFILLGAGFAVRGLLRKPARNQDVDDDQLARVDERLQRLESKLGDLEERLDFTERMLTEVRGRAQIPGKS